jgi:TrmH family RNA methyltransferase
MVCARITAVLSRPCASCFEMAEHIKAISSRDNPLLVRIRKLVADHAAYRKLNEIWIEGEHLCSAFANRGGKAVHAVISEEGWESTGLREIANSAASISIISQALMSGLSSLESSAPIGFVVAWSGNGTIDFEAPSVILDRLQDAGNVGNILRSASAFGFKQVVAIKGTAAFWSPKVLRAGMGAHFGLKLVESPSEDALDAWKLPMLATSSHSEQNIHEAALPWPCAWVMGHEGQGVSASLMQRCAQSLRIPQPGGEESLNVASAAAVCLYESARQRAMAR